MRSFTLTLRLTLTVGLSFPIVISRAAATEPLALTRVIVVHDRELPTRLLWNGGKTAEQAWQPEAHAVLVRKRDRR